MTCLPSFMQSKGTSFRNVGVLNLHKAHGICAASFETNKIVLVSPQSWHHYMRKLEEIHKSTYHKCDRNDAIAMALTVYAEAQVAVPNEEDVVKYLFPVG